MKTPTQTQNRGEDGKAAKDGGLDEMAKRKGIEKPTYTQIPNVLFDELMRDMGEAELKVTLAIMRQTFGWHRQFYEMSLTDLQQITGMSRPSVTKGISDGIKRGTVRRKQDAEGNFYYGLVVNDADDNDGNDYPLVKKPKLPSKRSLPVASKNSLPVEPEGSKEFLPGTSKEFLPEEPVTSKEFLPEVVNNFYQERQELHEKIPLLKKGKKVTTKEREKERSSSSFSSSSAAEKGKDDDDDLALKSVLSAWNDSMPEKATNYIRGKLREMIDEYGPDLCVRAISTAALAGGRSFKYVATCAQNLAAGVESPREADDAARRSEYTQFNHLLRQEQTP